MSKEVKKGRMDPPEACPERRVIQREAAEFHMGPNYRLDKAVHYVCHTECVILGNPTLATLISCLSPVSKGLVFHSKRILIRVLLGRRQGFGWKMTAESKRLNRELGCEGRRVKAHQSLCTEGKESSAF